MLDLVSKGTRTHGNVFVTLPFHWMAQHEYSLYFFKITPRKTVMKGDFQDCSDSGRIKGINIFIVRRSILRGINSSTFFTVMYSPYILIAPWLAGLESIWLSGRILA